MKRSLYVLVERYTLVIVIVVLIPFQEGKEEGEEGTGKTDLPFV